MKTRNLTIISLFCLFAISLQAKRVPGVSEDSIHVGVIADLSGPIAFYGNEQLDGMRLYLDHINKQGGVHGRKIVLHHEDDGYSPPRSIAAFRKLLDRDRVFCFAGNLGSPTVMATLPFIKRANVPLVAPANFNSRMYRPFNRNVFSMGPCYYDQSWLILKHIQESSNGVSPRIAVIYQDDDMGLDALSGLHDAAKAYHIELVGEESYKRSSIDFSSQVLNLKSKKPTHVILFTVYREAAAILKKANQIGLDAIFIGNNPVADAKVIELAGQDAKNLQVLNTMDFWAETPTEQLRSYNNLMQQYDPGRKATLLHSIGYSIAQVLVEGLERAGRALTREKLVLALESFQQFETVVTTFTYGPSTRGGSLDRAFILQALPEEGRFERITDWITHDSNTELAKKESNNPPQG